jgi:predicted DCC family thiol-disulfide oxidoreductase YuxK
MGFPARPPDGRTSHLVVFDGTCGLCQAVVQFLLQRDRRKVFLFASLQSEPGANAVRRTGGDPTRLDTFYVVSHWGTTNERGFHRSDAALFITHELGGLWRFAALARVIPRPWRDRVYDIVATHRHRLFGTREACLLPTPAERARFVERGGP